MQLTVPLALAAADDRRVTGFSSLTRSAAFGAFALRTDRMPAAFGSTFATTMRVIDGVHRRTANMRTPTKPTGSACFS